MVLPQKGVSIVCTVILMGMLTVMYAIGQSISMHLIDISTSCQTGNTLLRPLGIVGKVHAASVRNVVG